MYGEHAEPKAVLMWLGSPDLRVQAARLIVRAIGRDAFPEGFADDSCPLPKQIWWAKYMGDIDEDKVAAVIEESKLDDWEGAYEGILRLATLPVQYTSDDRFLGEVARATEEYCYNNVDTLLCSNHVCENTFSQAKRTTVAGESAEMMDIRMVSPLSFMHVSLSLLLPTPSPSTELAGVGPRRHRAGGEEESPQPRRGMYAMDVDVFGPCFTSIPSVPLSIVYYPCRTTL
jgi:hypothetical protein